MHKTNCMQSIENIFQYGKYLVAYVLKCSIYIIALCVNVRTETTCFTYLIGCVYLTNEISGFHGIQQLFCDTYTI